MEKIILRLKNRPLVFYLYGSRISGAKHDTTKLKNN